MQKITLLLTLMVSAFLSIQAQTYSSETISFETTEGYTAGDINGQGNWITTKGPTGDFILNQTVSDEGTLDGSNTLKLTADPAYGGQTFAVIGALYTYDTPVSNDDAAFSASFYMSEQGFTSMSVLLGLVHFDDPTEAKFRTYFNFGYDGNSDVIVKGTQPGLIDNIDSGFDWQPNTWYTLKIQTAGSAVTFYIDGNELLTRELVSTGPINQLRFAHDNYGGLAYIDNIKTEINPSTLSVTDFDMNAITHFYSKDLDQLVLNSQDDAFTSVAVYNLLGQNVISTPLSKTKETVDFSSLNNGIYVVKLNVGGRTKSIKILKY